MSFEAMAWAIKQKAGGPTSKIVLLCLANYADEKNQTFASQGLIATQAEVSLRTVRDAIKLLEGGGLIRREARRRKDGTRTTDLFTLAGPPAESAARQSATGRIRIINRQILPDKEPITEPITLRGKNGSGKKRVDGARWETLASLIDVPKEPRRRAS